jgi:hypothetical protein
MQAEDARLKKAENQEARALPDSVKPEGCNIPIDQAVNTQQTGQLTNRITYRLSELREIVRVDFKVRR